MASTQRFTTVDKAILVGTGNSLVICGSDTDLEINTSDLIKPNGLTTRDWTQSGSTANLNILANSKVLYAELVWYSTVFSNVSGALNLTSIQDNPITFTTSEGTYQIAPDYVESYSGPSGSIDRYRAANVTTYIQDVVSGNYTVSNVPISIPTTGLSNSRGGWTLVVIYKNDIFKPQKIVYESGISVVTPDTPIQSTVNGFTTSSNPALLKGNIFMVAANGSPLNGEEIVSVGPSFTQLTNVGNPVLNPNPNPGTAPNNPANNFFSGLINMANPMSETNGLININGTNGTNNNDGFVPIQVIGARNKWDITNVDISKTLFPNQTLIAQQITESTSGDGVALVARGTQVLAQAPDIIATLIAYDVDDDNENNVEVGSDLQYSVKIKNSSSIAANNITLSTIINPCTTFVPDSVIVNGIIIPGADITKSVNIGSIDASGIIDVRFSIRVNSLPQGPIQNDGIYMYNTVDYSYQFISGGNTITNHATTNTVEVIVEEALLSITKLANKTNMGIGDIVTYTLDIENIGTVTATDIFVQDKSTYYSSFISGSVIIDGVRYIGYDPNVGFYLPDLNPLESTEIVFEYIVNSLPTSTVVNNSATVSFGYIYNQYGYIREKTILSNIISIQINYINVVGERCNNNNYPNVGDIVTYTLNLSNIGNEIATDIQVLEPPIPGTSFITASVNINGVNQPTLNPFTGFILPNSINPQQTTNINYQVSINQLNPDNTIENIAQVPFRYQIGQDDIISTNENSNIVDTVANYICMNVVKSVDKEYAQIDDILYYKVNVSNSGNINATNIVFYDSLQQDITVVKGSVAINGLSYPTYDPTKGFEIGIVCPNDMIEVTFQAKVKSIPNPNIVYNHANIVFTYQPNPISSSLTNTVYSNTVQTIINKVSYTVVKSVNKTYVQEGEDLVYTTVIQNTGTIPLTNLVFADYTGTWLHLYPGSVYINGINYPTYNPNETFPLDNMSPGDTTIVVFEAKYIENPPSGYISNTAEVTMSYQLGPNYPIITQTVYSNTVITNDPLGELVIVKSVDKAYAVVGETLTYSFTITNKGSANLINTMFADVFQGELTFVDGSVIVDYVSQPTYDPQVGFTLGTIYIGQVINVSFQATVNTLPIPNVINNSATNSFSYYINPANLPVTTTAISNTVSTVVNSYSSTLTKQVDRVYATIGDTISYTVTIQNTGTVPLEDVTFIDIIDTYATFVSGSVIINGTSSIDANPNLGFTLPDISAGGTTVIIFQVTVNSLPPSQLIRNKADITFRYQLTPTTPYINTSLISNTVTTNIRIMSVTNTKSVDKIYSTVGDILTYTSVIANNSNVNILDTYFVDSIESNLSFVTGSVIINGTAHPTYNPNTGFTLENMSPGSTITVVFLATVNSLPSSGYVNNTSTINYNYYINPDKSAISSSVISNLVTTYINKGSLTITKAANRTIAKLNNVITYSFVISNTGNTNLTNLFFQDTIQSESSFNIGSVYVNGINRPSLNPNIGFSLDDIPVGQQTKVSFTLTVNSIPMNNELLNTGSTIYSYYVNPNTTPITNTATSNQTIVYVYDTIMSADKSVDKGTAKIGETLNYTIKISNDGNVIGQNIFFRDILDSNISFVVGSVYINGNQQIGYNPNIGFSLLDIGPGVTTTIEFQAIVVSKPIDNTIYNSANINYDYIIESQLKTATITTNIIETIVATGELTIIKSVDKIYATVGDNLYYTVIVKNTGSVNATNIILQDLIPSSTSFNEGSVVVDGTPQPTFNPNTGFNLSDLVASQYHTVVFSVNVTSLPQNREVYNTANVTFTYKSTPLEEPITTTTSSNTVKTYIKVCTLNLTKTVDKAYTTIGNILNYSITITNTGNETAQTVFFKDIVQSDAQLVIGSVKINGITQPTYDPNVGFYLANIPGYGTTIVTFQVTVQTLPLDYIIYNNAIINYSYFINPSNPSISAQSTSNTVMTTINISSLIVTKAVSKVYATIGDIVTYTINIKNTGNVVCKNVNFRDNIPNGLTFINQSVTINGISYLAYNPNTSFTLGSMVPGDAIVVKFDTIVTSLPNPSLINNTANITYAYRINPNSTDIIDIVNSNTVNTQINIGTITIQKSVDKSYATIGDVLSYTVVISNTGNVNIDNVIFTDSLQSDITFNQGSVKIDGVSYTEYNPEIGFSLGTIVPLGYRTVSFTVTVISSPISSIAMNDSLGTFQYKINPNAQYYSKSKLSNSVTTRIIVSVLTATKTVDKVYSVLQDILSYSILVKNDGNTSISQILFKDFLSPGAVFIPSTVAIDGISYPTYDPIEGFNLPSNLIAGKTNLVEFQATVTSIPSPSIITNYATANGVYRIDPQGPTYPISTVSNTVVTNINVASISNVKAVDKVYAKVNYTLIYTSTITNTGNVNLTNLFFIDTLQPELKYINETVSINGIIYPSLNPITGFVLSNLAPGQSVVVVFSAKVNLLPTPPYVTNNSQLQYTYKIDPNGSPTTTTQNSNTVATNVVSGELTAVKTVDKSIATIGDDLTYTIILTNVGTVIVNDIFFQDIPSSAATFKLGSVKVNGTSRPDYDPTVGFSVGDIDIGNVLVVEFKATIVSIPPTNQVTNEATVTFEFFVNPQQPPFTQTTFSNIVITNISYGNLSVTKVVDKQYVTIGDKLNYTVTIVNTGNINVNNVTFIDQVPNNTVFILQSVIVNGVSYPQYNPSAGFNLGTMTPGQINTVTYKVEVFNLC